MANITLLSWNIQNYGPSKFVNPVTGTVQTNAIPLLEAIASTTVHYQANVLSILELSPSVSVDVATWLVNYLAMHNSTGAWNYVLIDTHKSDTYCIIYQSGHGFEFLNDPANNNEPVRGYTQKNASGNNLLFHSRFTTAGGRRPGFVAFQTTDRSPAPEIIFTIICYHAMFNTYIPNNQVGLNSVPKIAPVTGVVVNGIPMSVAATIIGGDFNVDSLTWPTAYQSSFSGPGWSIAIDPTLLSDNAKSSLKDYTPPLGYPSTVDYRVNAYDNIFARNAVAVPGSSTVIDMIHDLKWGNTLAHLAQNFNPAGIEDGHLITSNPPNNNEDAWHIYRHGISNHLPVIGSFIIRLSD